MKLQTLKSRVQQAPSKVNMLTQRPGATPRLRGRAAVDRRTEYLICHPYCVECKKEGRIVLAQVVDHKQPLWAGGADDYDTNGQSLCSDPHHDAKTKCEARMRAAGAWLSTQCTCGMHP